MHFYMHSYLHKNFILAKKWVLQKDPEWLQCRTKLYRVGKDGLRDVVEEMDCDGKLRQ
jgi:hypothetical protein